VCAGKASQTKNSHKNHKQSYSDMNSRLADMTAAAEALRYPTVPVISLQNQRRILKLWIVLTDALALALAFQIAFWLRFGLQVTIAPEVVPSRVFYLGLTALLVPVWILVFLVFNLYNLQMKLGGIAEYAHTFNACTTSTMIVVIIAFFEPQFIVSRAWLVFSWMLTFLLVALNRFANRRLVYALRKGGYLLTPAAVVGTNQEAVTLASDLCEWRTSGLRILGFVCSHDSDKTHCWLNIPILGTLREIHKIVAAHGIEDLIVATTALQRDDLLQLGEDANGISGVNLRLSSGLYELFTTGVTVKTVGTVPLLSVNKIRLEQEEVYIKYLLDYTLALTILFFAWPVYLLIALLIKLDSPGPVLHRRRVLGVSGRQFDAFKFRTMFVNGDELLKDKPELILQLGTDHKLKNDPRVTRIGIWLRRFSLDELPQLFNVLRGQMSLVGPRMITPVEADKYGNHKLNLLTVKPGVTGLWQVSGRSDVSYEDRVRLDMYYIRNYSVWLDLQILFVQTLPAVLKSRGAY
jgi:exopolysaccharide biosynthesis polyprenyl glycosylphosphotransferase